MTLLQYANEIPGPRAALSNRVFAIAVGAFTLEAEAELGAAQKTVVQKVRVLVRSRDRPRRVDAGGPSKEGRSRNVEGGQGAVASAQEAMIQKIPVSVPSRDRPRRVDAQGVHEDGARNVHVGEAAVASAEEAMRVPVIIKSRDRPR